MADDTNARLAAQRRSLAQTQRLLRWTCAASMVLLGLGLLGLGWCAWQSGDIWHNTQRIADQTRVLLERAPTP
jgi:hypothetical protein